MAQIEYNPKYIHHVKSGKSSAIRELVFGMEDGMVSTLGTITGIAAATGDLFITVLSGLVVISVESISMGVGSYLSSKSVRSIDERKLAEEKEELKKYPQEEREELAEMYIKDGWPDELAGEMAEAASKNSELFLQEMAYRELKIFPTEMESPLRNGIIMGVSYVIGGIVPLISYFVSSSLYSAIAMSISITLVGLFLLGVYTARLSGRRWWKSGLEMLGLASVAAIVGYVVGQVVDRVWL